MAVLNATYDDAGQLTKLTDAAGKPASTSGGGFNGEQARRTVRDAGGGETEA